MTILSKNLNLSIASIVCVLAVSTIVYTNKAELISTLVGFKDNPIEADQLQNSKVVIEDEFQSDALVLSPIVEWNSEGSDIDTPLWMTESELVDFEVQYQNNLKKNLDSIPSQDDVLNTAVTREFDSNTEIHRPVLNVTKASTQMIRDIETAKEAHRLFGQYRAPEAQLKLRRFIQQYPQSIWSRVCYIHFLFKQELWDKAYEQITKALETTENDKAFIKLLARWHIKRGDFNRAHIVLSQYNPVDIKLKSKDMKLTAVIDAEFIAMQAALSQQTKRFAIAVYLYEQLIEVEPTEFNYWLGLAAALDAMQESEKAYYAYNSALSMMENQRTDAKTMNEQHTLWRYAAIRRYQLNQNMMHKTNL